MKPEDPGQGGQRSSRLTFQDDTASTGDGGFKKRLILSGRVTEPEIVALRREGEQWLATLSDSGCVVDLDAVETASSILLSLLLCWQRQAHGLDLEIRFEGANQRLQALAVMSRVDHELPGLSIA